jgi:HTH-type transcriptional regulator/antitoxin HigA
LTPAQESWLYRCHQLAANVKVGKFTTSGLERILERLRSCLQSEDAVSEVPGILFEGGVRFVLVEAFPASRIDGACFWSATVPTIAMSMRFDRIDYFWFTLLHEIGHVKSGHGRGCDKNFEAAPSIDCGLFDSANGANDEENGLNNPREASNDKPAQELEADNFALRFLFPNSELDSFQRDVRPAYSKMKIREFADSLRLHPGIVVGQLQHRREISYAHSRELLVKVRSRLIESALSDGWGEPASVPNE